MLAGNNGILQKATDAKTKTDEAQVRERIQLAYHSALTKDITGESGELTMSTLQEELDNEFKGKEVTITPSADKKEWTIKVDDVEETVPAGKTTVASNLTDEEKTALQTNGIAEITGDDISNDNLKDNSRIKAVLTGNVPLTNEMTYITRTVDTGVVVSIDGNEFVWVPVPVAVSSDTITISTSEVDLEANPTTERPMAKLQTGSTTNYEGLLYSFRGTTSTYQPTYNVTTTNNREPAYLTNEWYADASSYNTVGITSELLQSEYDVMIASVNKYGGFYVGRYELGLDGNNNSVSKPASSDVTNSVTTAETSNSNSHRWYGLYSKCKSMYPKSENANVTSTMIWGSQYDAMMNWMAKTGKTVGWWSNVYNPNQTTGSKAEDVLNNVYDLYGCHYEITLEAYGDGYRVMRGGDFRSGNQPADRVTISADSGDYPYNGSRVTIYIK